MANGGRRRGLLAHLKETLEPAPDHYDILDMGLAQRMGGLLWLVGGLVALGLLPFAPPDAALGRAGWPAAAVLVALAAASGLLLLHRRVGRPRELLAMSIAAPLSVGVMQWLAGATAPYSGLLVLSLLWSASAHPPREVVGLALLCGAVALSPLAYGPAGVADVACHASAVAILWTLAACCLLWTQRLRDARRELERRHAAADALARLDALTGLGNRRALDEALQVAVAVVDRTGRNLSVLAGDLDGFKAINDRHGHQTGDDALRAVGSVLRDAVRRPDRCFRWGGDEFVVILPDASLAEAQAVAERLRDAIADRCRDPDGRPLAASFGAAEHVPWMRGDELLAAADAALLGRKRAERAERAERTASGR